MDSDTSIDCDSKTASDCADVRQFHLADFVVRHRIRLDGRMMASRVASALLFVNNSPVKLESFAGRLDERGFGRIEFVVSGLADSAVDALARQLLSIGDVTHADVSTHITRSPTHDDTLADLPDSN